MKKEISKYYPVFLKVSGKKCVVVGGGEVALRKVRTLLDNSAAVKVISPELCPELDELAHDKEISIKRRNYRSGDLKQAFIVIAATGDRDINLKVVNEANKLGVLVNVVDDADGSDFILPSCLRRGDVTIAVSTAGRSPALARKIRSKLDKEMGDEYAALAIVADEVRMGLKSAGIKVSPDEWQRALDMDLLLDLLKNNDRTRARAHLLDNLKAQNK